MATFDKEKAKGIVLDAIAKNGGTAWVSDLTLDIDLVAKCYRGTSYEMALYGPVKIIEALGGLQGDGKIAAYADGRKVRIVA